MSPLTAYETESLERELAERGFKPAHARRILREFYAANGELDISGWRVDRKLKDYLGERIELRASRVSRQHESADGTRKYLITYEAGGAVEAVLMPAHRADRSAVCVSSQIGCAMGCDFCASTKNGLERNLSAGEIAEQYLHLKGEAAKLGRKITTLVFMGMGEPLHNFENVTGAIRRIADPDMGGLGWRQVTVSTVGIVPGIYRLAEADLNVHLALSLHAPDDETRAKIIPANRRYPVKEVVEAAREFHRRTHRIVTIEYTLLAGVNDSEGHARKLGELLEGFRAHVNLIPYNPIGQAGVSGVVYVRPAREGMVRFRERLIEMGVVTHFRATRGDDVSAACGQLAGTGREGRRGKDEG